MPERIWAVPQLKGGALAPAGREALAAARRVAELLGGSAEAVLLHSGATAAREEIAALDLAAAHEADAAVFSSYTPGVWVGALAQAIAAHAPRVVILPHSYQTVDFLPRLAQELQAPLVPEAVSVRRGDGGLIWTRPVLGGKLLADVRARGEGPLLVSVQAGAFPADGVGAGDTPLSPLELDLDRLEPGRQVVGVEEAGEDQIDLSQAERIVAVGRGVGGEEKLGPVRELAEALGAELGASRPVIDSGWLPRDRQIGSSGQTVAPKLYLALGISGAIQHQVGMKGSQVVVAVNKDRNAPIFAEARYGVVGDLHEIVPELTAALRESG
ncbi:MAG: electron transfer flavoprotein subunit alpha/FixB family protein [Thermoanaerobaculia bacterium]|nr:electron transfer flavoprotein subunit alpha/FixB family protein [Thermoanaerobaculia bacterium]